MATKRIKKLIALLLIVIVVAVAAFLIFIYIKKLERKASAEHDRRVAAEIAANRSAQEAQEFKLREERARKAAQEERERLIAAEKEKEQLLAAAKKPKPAPPPAPVKKIEPPPQIPVEPEKIEPDQETEVKEPADISAEATSPGASYLIAGHNAYKQKDYGAAIKYLKKSVEADPDLFLAHYWLGRSYAQKGKHAQAVPSLEKALSLRSEKDKDIDIEYFLAWEYVEALRYDSAISLYRERIEKNPDNLDNHFGLAFALKKSGDLDAAASKYRKAIELNPSIPSIHYNLANTLEELGRSDEAIPEYQKAIDLNPDYGEAYFNMGVALVKAGKNEEAIEAFNKCIEMGHREREARKQIKAILRSTEE